MNTTPPQPPAHATRHPTGRETHAYATHLMSCNGATLHVPKGTHGRIVENKPGAVVVRWDHEPATRTTFLIKNGLLLPEGGLVVSE